MEQKQEWVNQYFTPAQRAKLAELSRQSYSEEARRQLASRGAGWTVGDQKRAAERWGWGNAELTRLVAAGADPTGPAAQAWAKERATLLAEFSQGSAEITAGLERWWESFWALPEE